jgi:hypothetical protein
MVHFDPRNTKRGLMLKVFAFYLPVWLYFFVRKMSFMVFQQGEE